MANPLIIVDSDFKGKLFLDFFKQQADILIVSSPPFQLDHSCFIDEVKNRHDLTFTFTPLPSHKQLVEQLLEQHDREIFLALDNDQPSEYICWLISSYLLDHKEYKGRVKRLDVTGYCHDEIKRAIDSASASHPESGREFYVRLLFNLSLSRHLQRLVGFTKGPGRRPLNYATLTAIFLLVDRDVEIKIYSARKKWKIIATMGQVGKKISAHLECAPDIAPKGVVEDLAKGKELVDRLSGEKFLVNEVERSELRLTAPFPYTLAELCHDALTLYGIGPDKVLTSLQRLYNGILLKGRVAGLISSFTFMKNDFGRWQEIIRDSVTDLYGDDMLRNEVNKFSGNHIIPLIPKITVEDVSKLIDGESRKIYTLVRGRALASQMKDAVGSCIRVQVTGNGTVFQAHINSITNLGFLVAHQGKNDPELMTPSPFGDIKEGDSLDFLGAVPEETVGNVAEHYTSETLFADLAEFSVPVDPGSLRMLQGLLDNDYVKAAKGGYLVCGPSSNGVATYINKAFPKMAGVNLSAYIEQTVTEVLSGRKGLDFAIKQFEQTLMIQGKILVKAKFATKLVSRKRSASNRIIKHVATIPSQAGNLQEKQEEEVGNVVEMAAEPECLSVEAESEVDAKLLDEEGGTNPEDIDFSVDDGVNLPEEKVDECNETDSIISEEDVLQVISEQQDAHEEKNSRLDDPTPFGKKRRDKYLKDEEAQEAGIPLPEAGSVEDDSHPSVGDVEKITTDQCKDCQICGRPMILKKDQFGKFWDCSGFPECRHSETFHSQGADLMSCPICIEGTVVTKRTPTGKTFYVCLGSTCEFMAWSRPHSVPCQVCDSPYLVEKKSAQGRHQLRCPRAGCNYIQPIPGEDGHELLQEQRMSPAAVGTGKPKKRRVVRRVKGKGTVGKKKVRVIRRRK